jgi:hypothetical protein
MKKILFIFDKKRTEIYSNKLLHSDWVNECKEDYDIDFWGKDFGDTSLQNLKNKIDSFKPDYLYGTMKKRYINWLPDLSSIKVPKIFVECDTWEYNYNDDWYKQFDKIYIRGLWGKNSQKYNKEIGNIELFNKRIKNEETWERVPLFRWSVPEKWLEKDYYPKNKIYFIGRSTLPAYEYRIYMYNMLNKYIIFKPKINKIKMFDCKKYLEYIRSASALVCPTESAYGDFIPAKIFEYATSGAAILTNCDLISYNMKDLDNVVIKYKDLDDLKYLIKNTDFTKYYDKAKEVIKNHTHKIRYKELFK